MNEQSKVSHNRQMAVDDQYTNEDIMRSRQMEVWITPEQLNDSIKRLNQAE